MLATSGTAHLVAPAPFESIVPEALGSPRPWVSLSGVAELGCAAALAVPRTRSAAGWACAALLVAVYPANVTMALRARRGTPRFAVALARLPVQVPLVWWAVSVARTPLPAPSARSARPAPPSRRDGASA